MEDWKEYKLGDVCIISSSKRIFAEEYTTNGIPFYRGKEIIEKHNKSAVSSELFITQKRFNEIKSKFPVPQKNDILLTSVGTLGVPWLVNEENFYFKDGNLTWLRCNEQKINPCFLYYWLESSFAKNQIDAKCIGSTQKALTIDTLSKFDINLPPLPTQQKIAGILSSLDDKIELNNKINASLEQQARAIFKSWFVDFEPFGGKMPAGWKTGKLSELITVKYGKDHKKLNDGSIPVYGSGGIMRYVEKALYEKESVLIPRKGTLSNVFYINEPFWSVDTMFYTEMKMENIAKYVYFFVKSKDLESMNAGSAVPSMTTDILNALELVIPSNEYLQKFETVISPMFLQMKQLENENKTLSAIRNTLLPKLMSGELKV